MINNDSEYRRSVIILEEWQDRHAKELRLLKDAGHAPDEIGRMTQSAVSFHLGIAEEVEHYEAQHRPLDDGEQEDD